MKIPEIRRGLREVAERLVAGGVAELSLDRPGVVMIDGEKLCRLSSIVALLRVGIVEVAGARAWRVKKAFCTKRRAGVVKG